MPFFVRFSARVYDLVHGGECGNRCVSVVRFTRPGWLDRDPDPGFQKQKEKEKQKSFFHIQSVQDSIRRPNLSVCGEYTLYVQLRVCSVVV